MRSVTVMSVAFFGVDRGDEVLDHLALAIYNLAELAGLDRPVITSSTELIPSNLSEVVPDEELP